MRSNSFRLAATLVILFSVLFVTFSTSAQKERIQYPDASTAREIGARDSGPTAKLTPDLRILFTQFSGSSKSSSGMADISFSDQELKEIYGITDMSGDPLVALAVTVSGDAAIASLKQRGMSVFLRTGDTVYGQAPISALARLGVDRSVVSIAPTTSAKIPERPTSRTAPQIGLPEGAKGGARSTSAVPPANEFNKATLTGKGAIVGVIDTGIDIKHQDFIRPDGTSRIIAIWDLFDNSFRDSGGKIGSAPPKFNPADPALPGTVYTNAQINAALKGTGTVNTVDLQGHGTAVAGTAAGNGRASAGLHQGVATDADLIILRASECGGFSPLWHFGAAWMADTAQTLKRPLVVNGSFGGHYSAHNGTESQEKFVNAISGAGKPGIVFTLSAGNEGRQSMHATGRFGPKRPGQSDVLSDPISVNVTPERAGTTGGKVMGVFDSRDEWGFVVVPSANSRLKDTTGKPLIFFVWKTAAGMKWNIGKGLTAPAEFTPYMNAVLGSVAYGRGGSDTIILPLLAGSYDILGMSMSPNVTAGSFSLYAPSIRDVDFGSGTTKSGMVGSPGNAASAITVGAYDFRSSWTNKANQQTFFNLPIGRISDYSSPGGKRADGVVKPDIAAPATYHISSLSSGATATACGGGSMGANADAFITPDGKYIAWNGTSASSPFTAGVIALMLQKNPTLDAEQIRQILIKTAGKTGEVGAVPNADWGYGRLEPAAAIQATPAPGAAGKPVPAKPAAKPPVKKS